MSDDWDDVHWQDATPVEETMISNILAQQKRIEELEAQLRTVLDREAATIARYDAKLDAADAKLTIAIKALTRLSTSEVHGNGEALGCVLSSDPLGREILARMEYASATIANIKGKQL